MLQRTFFFLSLYLLIPFCKAQDAGFFKQVWLEEGLSQSSITCMAQDGQGYMWFGTQDGLNRYDGRRIDHFNFEPFNPNSISGDNIFSIVPDSNGLLVQTPQGVDKLRAGILKASEIPLFKDLRKKGIKVFRIWEIDNQLFSFCSDGFYSNNKTKRLVKYELMPRVKDKKVLVFNLCKNGNVLYAATNQGIYVCQKDSSLFSALILDNNELNGPSFSIGERGDSIYFHIGNYLFIYNPISSVFIKKQLDLDKSSIANLLVDNRGKIWVGTNGRGLYQLNDKLEVEKHYTADNKNKYGLKSNYITCLFQGTNPQEEVVWIGTSDAGAFSFSYSKNSFDLISFGLGFGVNYFAIVKDSKGEIWASNSLGIHHFNRKNKKAESVDLSILKNSMKSIEAMYCDGQDQVWLAVNNSLFTIDKVHNRLQKVLDNIFPGGSIVIYKLLGTGNDELLIGSEKGIAVYNISEKKISIITDLLIKQKTTKLPPVGVIYIDEENSWWIGTTKGLFLKDKTDEEKNRFFEHDPNNFRSLLSDVIMDINEDRSFIYIATTKGLSILNKDKNNFSFENFYSAEGLSNNFIYGIVKDKKGNLWMSTNFGISCFDPVHKSFRTYHAEDGIFINEFNSAGYFVAEDGELLFGGIGGLIGFYPDKLVKNMLPPKVILRSFKINQSDDSLLSRSSNSNIELNHNQNDLYFEFSVLDFTGEKPKLFYLLEGKQQVWVEIKDAYSLTLANLSPGLYNLKVKAINAEGLQSTELFTMAILIHPPFWQTGWFVSLSILALLLITFAAYRYKVRSKIRSFRENELIRQEENEKVRKSAALDLHDEFGNGLTRISMLAEMAKLKIDKENPEATNILNTIGENSIRLYNGTKDFIWSINPGNDNLYEIIVRIKDFADELFYESGIDFKLTGLEEEYKAIKKLPGTGRNIVMIFKEALSNILKHAKATEVLLKAEILDGKIILRLIDNGKGFESAKSNKGFGISNMHQRAKRIKAEVEISTEQTGTEIKLELNIEENG